VFIAAVGCGGSSPARDAGADATDSAAETAVDVPSSQDGAVDAPADVPGTDVAPDAATDTAADAADAANDGGQDAANDGGNDATGDVSADAATDGSVTDTGPEAPAVMLTVDAVQNALLLDRCGTTPATLADVAAGAHTLTLTASTLSKGAVSDDNGNPIPAVDPYVIVNLPLPAGDPGSHRRFFMLNGVGTAANVSLPAVGTIRMMFIDSDMGSNSGQGTVALDTAGPTGMVDGAANLIPWDSCSTTPATVTISNRLHRVTLVESTLSSGGGSKDDFVILRIPNETATNAHRYVILNGIGASHDFTPYKGTTLRAWFLAATSGATGRATLVVTDP
jgi:hypothetical protein